MVLAAKGTLRNVFSLCEKEFGTICR